MSIESLDWLHEDIRSYLAIMRFILFRCCKRKYEVMTDEEGESWCHVTRVPLDFMQLKWIIDRCNFEMAKDYGITFIPNSFLSWFEDSSFIPETFDTDFTCAYVKQKNGKLRKKKANYTEKDFISEAELEIAKRVIRRWKIYGRICQSISDWWWVHVTGKFTKRS